MLYSNGLRSGIKGEVNGVFGHIHVFDEVNIAITIIIYAHVSLPMRLDVDWYAKYATAGYLPYHNCTI